jgi:hypothetical protein
LSATNDPRAGGRTPSSRPSTQAGPAAGGRCGW